MTAISAVLWDFGGVITSSPFEAFSRFEEARGMYERSLATREKLLGPRDLKVAVSCEGLAWALSSLAQPEAAGPQFERQY